MLILKQYEYGSRFECDHAGSVLVRRVKSNNVVAVGKHCPDCGRWTEVPKRGIDLESLPEYRQLVWSETPLAVANREQRESDERARDLEFEAKREQRRAEYETYLDSPEWAERRRRVFERAHKMCEACGVRLACEVHHTTYEHLGHEPLWELRAVCRTCHNEITTMDRQKRMAG